MADYIETDACVKACGVDRNSVGISSDALLEPQFTGKLCSPACYQNCPNIVDLYFNLAAGEGMILQYVHVFNWRILFLQFLFQRNIICSWLKTKGITLKYWPGVLKCKIGECHVQFLVAAIHFVFEFLFFFLFLGLFSHLRSDLIAISIHIFRKIKIRLGFFENPACLMISYLANKYRSVGCIK